MGNLFRSEEMCLTQLYLQSEAAFACVSELGELGMAQFRDLNSDVNAFQRKFVNEVRRCDEMERKLRFLERELKKDNIPIDDSGENPIAPLPKEMFELESKFDRLEIDMKEVLTNQDALKRNFLELTELKHILRKTQNFFEEAAMFHEQQEFALSVEDESTQSLLESARSPFNKLRFVAGVVAREQIPAFERVLWRACRGNVFLRYTEIETDLEDPQTGDTVCKNVFIIFFQGEQLKSRVKKICEGFRATLYPCPETPQERREIAIGVMTRIEDLQTVLNQTDDHRRLVLSQVARSIRVWFIKVRKIKAIYHTLNLFNVNIADKCLIAECWCPVIDLDKIQLALRRGTELSGSSVPSILQKMTTDRPPPTYNRTDMYTSAFQTLIDAFGVANYQEVNPAPYTIITFPFLFAMMFGDVGHGLLMTLFAMYMVRNQRRFMAEKSNNEIWLMMFGGRFLVLLMGIFSIYTGFLYNDCFSRSINVFGSSWNVSAMNLTNSTLAEYTEIMIDPKKEGVSRGPGGWGSPYPYGMDPIWQSAFNKISFQNSYKMKGAIIMGFAHMVFGLILSLFNHLHFKDRMTLYCEWLPKMIFLWCMVGYLCIIVFCKWITWPSSESNSAPGLLIGLINMFMFSHPEEAIWYPGQAVVENLIVAIAVICVPWMLLARPIILRRQHRQSRQQTFRQVLLPSSVRSLVETFANKRMNLLSVIWATLFLLKIMIRSVFSVPGFRLIGKMLIVEVDPVYNTDSVLPFRRRGRGNYAALPQAADDTSDEASIIHHDELTSSTQIDDQDPHVELKNEEFEMGELMIHQIIHTIEYCLSCISHTASYLRLWALSLAHAELSEVLWSMIMHIGLSMQGVLGAVMTFVVFWAFAGLTIGILLVMEGLSAFLHAIRLHWVEFQSKFYKGEGYMFAPFSFELIVEGKVEE